MFFSQPFSLVPLHSFWMCSCPREFRKEYLAWSCLSPFRNEFSLLLRAEIVPILSTTVSWPFPCSFCFSRFHPSFHLTCPDFIGGTFFSSWMISGRGALFPLLSVLFPGVFEVDTHCFGLLVSNGVDPSRLQVEGTSFTVAAPPLKCGLRRWSLRESRVLFPLSLVDFLMKAQPFFP